MRKCTFTRLHNCVKALRCPYADNIGFLSEGRFGAPVHDTQTTTERRNRSCQEVHGNVSRAPTALSYGPARTFDNATIQPAFLAINIGRRIGTGTSNSA